MKAITIIFKSGIINCHRNGLVTTESLYTEFQDSEEFVQNSVLFRTDSLIDKIVMGNLGFLWGA